MKGVPMGGVTMGGVAYNDKLRDMASESLDEAVAELDGEPRG